MPLYEYRCRQCGAESEAYNRIAERESGAPACACGGQTEPFIGTPPMGHVQGECHYVCPKTGEQITSRKQRAENFARHGLMDANDFTPQYLHRTKTERRRKLNELAAQLKPPPGVTLEKVIAANPA